MKNRLLGVLIFLNIILILFLVLPFEREVKIEIDKKYISGLNEIDIVFIKDEKTVHEKKYFIKENFYKYNRPIEDKIRLAQGKYDLKIYLIYKDIYIIKEKSLPINITDFSTAIILGD
jgi:hypothetical protein